MKIGIDGSRAFLQNRTGIEEYSYQVIRYLRSFLGNENVILYIRSDQEVDFEIPKNWDVKKMYAPRLWTQLRLSLEMILNPPDVLFVPAHTVPFLHPKNTVVTIHGLEYEFHKESFSFWERMYMRFVIKNSCKWAQRIISVSRNTMKDLTNLYNIDEKKISVVYEGHPEFLKENAGTRILNDPYILFIGRIERRKNVEGIIKAFLILKEKYKIKHKLVLGGKPGYGYEEINEVINSIPTEIRSDILELGYVSEEQKLSLLSHADVFVFPSFYEGFGLPILEAQEMGVPVVASDKSSLPEVTGDSALLSDPNNYAHIAENIYLLLSDEGVKNETIKRGTFNVKRFSWAQCAREIAQMLKK